MKGLVLLFLALTLVGIGWGYASNESKSGIRKVVRKNLLPIILAVLAVAVAVVLSTSTTLRLV